MTPVVVKSLSIVALCIVSAFIWWGIVVIVLALLP
jgi:hypothetical protein